MSNLDVQVKNQRKTLEDVKINQGIQARKLERQNAKLDRVAFKLLDHDRRFDELVTKEEFAEFKRDVLEWKDKTTGTIERIDQERILANGTLDNHKNRIDRVEKVLKLPALEGVTD